MSTQLKEKLTAEDLNKESLLDNAPHTVTLEPRRHAYLYGRPGATYQLMVINTDEDLDAN